MYKTDQTTSYADYDDGYYQKGIDRAATRFVDNGNGTITDHFTGYTWLKNGNYNTIESGTGKINWADALSLCHDIRTTKCGLTDGSSAGDWRMPNIKELYTLVSFGTSILWPAGRPFTGMQVSNTSQFYWSSTTMVVNSSYALHVCFNSYTSTYYNLKTATNDCYVLPIRNY